MPEHDFINLPLRDLLTILLDHGYTFENLKAMNVVQLWIEVERINAGEVRSNHDTQRERREALANTWIHKSKRRK